MEGYRYGFSISANTGTTASFIALHNPSTTTPASAQVLGNQNIDGQTYNIQLPPGKIVPVSGRWVNPTVKITGFR
jgi:hypothetical protein